MAILHKRLEFSVQKAHEAQLQMSKRIIFEDRLPKKIRFVGGVDVAYVKDVCIGAVAIIDHKSLDLIESQTAVCKVRMPYIPTLLSFREIRASVLGIRKLELQPDLFLVDGQGFAHPYRCGFASHLGLVIGRPTIGVAKSRLFGQVKNVNFEEDVALLRHGHEVVGAVVRTKGGSKPVYVSVGHMASLKTAIRIVKTCVRDSRIPEPLLKAHQIANAEKRKIHIPSEVND
jgi:deoxyribonuclease V